jgi:hypothetical protein
MATKAEETQDVTKLWRPEDDPRPVPQSPNGSIYRPDILEAIELRITELDAELRELSLDLHSVYSIGLLSSFTDYKGE